MSTICRAAAVMRSVLMLGRLRSAGSAQDTFITARGNAVQVHGEGDQADMAAFTALKEKFEKRGDHWIAKRDPGD